MPQIAAFYKFASLPAPKGFRAKLLNLCKEEGLKGTILLSHEGINATVAGSEKAVAALLGFLKKKLDIGRLKVKFSRAPSPPFRRMRARLKKEIVTMGVKGVDPARATGERISPKDWNEVISDPDTLVLDTRNVYETGLGTFTGALAPKLESFRDFPEFARENLEAQKHKRIAMFCTGGIRCEKASSYLLQNGFQNVVQLDGGILDYIEKTPKEKSLWRGDCYVFDGRMAVDQELKPGGYTLCPTCRWPVSKEDKTHPDYEEGVTCRHCKSSAPKATIAASRERKKQMDLARARGERYLG